MKNKLALLSIACMFAAVGCDDGNGNSSPSTDPTPITTGCTANACVAGTNILNKCVAGTIVPEDCGSAGCNPATNACNAASDPTQQQCIVSVCSGNILYECNGGVYTQTDCGAAGCDPVKLACKTAGSGNDDPQAGSNIQPAEFRFTQAETATPCDFDSYKENCKDGKVYYCNASEDDDKYVVWEATCLSGYECATTDLTYEGETYPYAYCVNQTAGPTSDLCSSESDKTYSCGIDDYFGMYLTHYTYSCMKWSDGRYHYFPEPTDYADCTTCSETASGCVLNTCDPNSSSTESCNGMKGVSCLEDEEGNYYSYGIDCTAYAEDFGSSGCILEEGVATCDLGDLLDYL